jgi:methylthioribose-1-phosphate isomerase
VESVWYDGDAVGYLDQRALPQAVVRERASSVDAVVDAIRSLAVRGAPAIGIFGAYGTALAARQHAGGAFAAAAQRIREARPTAVNLAYAVDRRRRPHRTLRRRGAPAHGQRNDALQCRPDRDRR